VLTLPEAWLAHGDTGWDRSGGRHPNMPTWVTRSEAHLGRASEALNAIQQLLGHRSLHTTSVYLQHIAPAAAVAEATAKAAHLAVAP